MNFNGIAPDAIGGNRTRYMLNSNQNVVMLFSFVTPCSIHTSPFTRQHDF